MENKSENLEQTQPFCKTDVSRSGGSIYKGVNFKNVNKMAKIIRVGYDYLHNHTGMEKQLNIPQDHVIVDRQDWEEVIRFFNEHPEAIVWLKQKPKSIIKDGK